ncbi:mitochondrial carrier [Phanerochaete sordida]|uniref:Mitochondrial carrier n=1 Tax=Phanerochaete sordida TaxID=48140 RepID=A0A9P3GGX2_9APHY|nr:mitochondrial carrier [Phanerochaete sordida]
MSGTKVTKPQQLTPLGNALAGALGACFSNAIVYPLDVAKTRLQAYHKKGGHVPSLLQMMKEIYEEEGIVGYYKGFVATMLNTFSMQYAYFFFYSLVRTSYIKRLSSRLPKGSKAPPLSTAAELLLGAAAGALAQIFTLPVSTIATRQQIGGSQDEEGNPRHVRPRTARAANGDAEKAVPPAESADVRPRDDSFWGIAKEIYNEEGLTGFWLGLGPSMTLTVNPAITYGVFERVKSTVLIAAEKSGRTDLAKNGKLAPLMTFYAGSLSKILATIITYPQIMVKIKIQARAADAEEAEEEGEEKPKPNEFHHKHMKHASSWQILHRVYAENGFLGLYQGLGAQLLKAVLAQSLLFLSKDQFERWALQIIFMLQKLRQRI